MRNVKKVSKAFDLSNEGDLLFIELDAVASSFNNKAVVSASIALLLKRIKSEAGIRTIAESLMGITKQDIEKIHGCDSDNQRQENENSQKGIAFDS